MIVDAVVSINKIMCGDGGCIEWRLLKIFGSFDPSRTALQLTQSFSGHNVDIPCTYGVVAVRINGQCGWRNSWYV